MGLAKVTQKGQVLIPIEFRKKYGIEAPGKILITEKEGHLVILPVPQDPVGDTRGMLKPKIPLDISHEAYKKQEIALDGISYD